MSSIETQDQVLVQVLDSCELTMSVAPLPVSDQGLEKCSLSDQVNLVTQVTQLNQVVQVNQVIQVNSD